MEGKLKSFKIYFKGKMNVFAAFVKIMKRYRYGDWWKDTDMVTDKQTHFKTYVMYFLSVFW